MAQFDTKEIVIGGSEWNTAPFRFNRMTILGGSGDSYINVLLSGVSPLALTNAIGLNYIKALGKCEQNGTPTPTNPVDIICNNGAIKYSKNIFDKTLNPKAIGYATTYWEIRVPNGTYTCSTDIPNSGNNANVWFDNQPVFSSSVNPVFASQPRTITITEGVLYVAVRKGSYYNSIINGSRWIQIEQGSTATTYHPYGVYIDGNIETVSDSFNNTATMQNLLSIWDAEDSSIIYKDEQNILTGHITRRVGYYVLTGEETFYYVASNNLFYSQTTLKNKNVLGAVNCLSNYYRGKKSTKNRQIGDCYILTNGRLDILDDRFTGTTDFCNWLSQQYYAGTPVIIVYPLETPTTETVTGQTLTAEGDCTITATGSLNNLELELSYKQSI